MTVRVDLAAVRANACAIRDRVGVPVFAVVKADAYGLSAARVVAAVDDLVAGYCVFALREAVDARIGETTGKESIVLSPPEARDPQAWIDARARPAVSTVDQATVQRRARPVVTIDTGMQRFACPPADVDNVLRAGAIDEAMTHATSLAHVRAFLEVAGGRGLRLHAAGSSLLDEPSARLDAVRPGFALYRGAARVSARLVEARDSAGPVGYSGWRGETGRHGVILAGYSNGLRPGPCLVNGGRRRIPEVGMQSAFVELQPGDKVGDEVVLLGDDLAAEDVAKVWQVGPHEVLVRLTAMGAPTHVGP